jgi:hypothetical protein
MDENADLEDATDDSQTGLSEYLTRSAQSSTRKQI